MNSKLATILRLALGVVILIFGTNKLFNFLPAPLLKGVAGEFWGVLVTTGYFFPVLGLIEIVVGILLLLNKWKGLALIMLVPISVNILLFHLFLAPAAIGPAALVVILNGLLLYAYRDKFKTLF